MSLQSYTLLGSLIWEWEPFTSLDPTSRCLWLALYTSAEAKRMPPGLWHGSITAMSEAAKLPVDETMKSLDKMLERELVEYDQKNRVLRMTVLPDGLESPPNGNVIRGWFKKFKSVPSCAVRDAHVATLVWIMNEWSRETGKPISDKHQEAWSETFGQVAIPAPRRRGVKRLQESSTGTDVQPGLFDPPPSSASENGSESSNACGETVSPRIGPTSDGRSVDNSASDPDLKKSGSSTVREPFRNGSDQDQDPDPDLDLSFLKSGAIGGEDRDRESRPRLTLVPMPESALPLAMTPEELISRLSAVAIAYRPAILRETAQNALCATIRDLTAQGIGPEQLDACARWIARHGIGHTTSERWFQLCDWASVPGNILRALADADAHERKSAEATAELAEFKKQLGYTT